MRAPHYADMPRRAGVDVDAADPAAELLRGEVVVTGTPEEIAATLAGYRTAGVDEILLNPAGVLLTEGVHAAVADLEEIIAACHRLRLRLPERPREGANRR
ncbi:hypothetical protein FE633_43860 [Streptomyces montanus]|uniref:LLM class flavin-dependent oxidoreductase n=1 Tax=Streptomyces montanus TaxID=2580423 RepID=A0A5R9FA80_9ACTN|nr:hypothetical protein FE633_43860 [Streptomyces montanus]